MGERWCEPGQHAGTGRKFDERLRGCMQRYARSAQEGILVEIPHNLSDVLTKRIQSTFHTASEIAHTLKGTTARKVFQCFPEIKKQLWGGAFWSRSYYVGSVGDMSVDTVLKYIESGQD